MKIIRSIAGVVVGAIVGVLVVWIVETLNFVVNGPLPDKPFSERLELMKKMTEDPQVMKAWVDEMPLSALVVVQVAWSLGAFLGGGACALIAGRARLLHAGIIGALILVATVINFFQMKSLLDYSHPPWLMATGVLLPIPSSLLAGWFVAMLFPPPPPAPVVQT